MDPVEIESQQNTLISTCNAVARDQGYLALHDHHLASAMKMSPLIFRSAFSHLKQVSLLNSKQLSTINQRIHANDGENEKNSCLGSNRAQCSTILATSMPFTSWDLLSEESSYSCSAAVDPFWSLCMYELRGKCNNDECPWQHVKDYCDPNRQNQQSGYNNAGM